MFVSSILKVNTVLCFKLAVSLCTCMRIITTIFSCIKNLAILGGFSNYPNTKYCTIVNFKISSFVYLFLNPSDQFSLNRYM